MQTAQPSDFWKGKRVFVTGGTGFLGSHLTRRLEELGANLSLFIHKKQSPLSALRYYGDLQNPAEQLKYFLQGFTPEIVFHLASQPLVSEAARDEMSTMETNIGGTYRVMNACKGLDVKSFVHISTDKVYGDQSPITKDVQMNGVKHPYNASKHASDILAQMYSEHFDLPMVIIRNANVYGAGDTHFDRIVPRTIRQVFYGERPIIRGTGNNTRDYIHVGDLVDGYIQAAEAKFTKGGLDIINLGGFGCTTLQVVDTILEKMNRVDLAPTYEKQWKGEIPHQHIVNDVELINWNPKAGLAEGLDKTIPWYINYLRTHGSG